jgi:hypothetical protein
MVNIDVTGCTWKETVSAQMRLAARGGKRQCQHRCDWLHMERDSVSTDATGCTRWKETVNTDVTGCSGGKRLIL